VRAGGGRGDGEGEGPGLDGGAGEALAQSRNLWDPSLGMHGLQSEADLLNAMDIPAKTGAADWQQIASDVNGGNPVTLSTSWTPGGHYVVLEKIRPRAGASTWAAPATR
jgi:hypothetical protein